MVKFSVLRRVALNETATSASPGFSASDGAPSVNAYSSNGGATYIYGPPGWEPQRWGLNGNSMVPQIASLPADYVEVSVVHVRVWQGEALKTEGKDEQFSVCPPICI